MTAVERDLEVLTPAETAALFGVTVKTVSRWGDDGTLEVVRTPGGHRRYPTLPAYDLYGFLEGLS